MTFVAINTVFAMSSFHDSKDNIVKEKCKVLLDSFYLSHTLVKSPCTVQ